MSTTMITKRAQAQGPWRLLGLWLLLLPGVIALQPVFGDLTGFLPGFVAITLGSALAWVAYRFSWSIGWRVLSLFATYFVVGGFLVLPRTLWLGVIPSPETFKRLVLLTFQSWNDLLTVATPAGDLAGPAAAPLLAGLIAGSLCGWIAMETRTVLRPMSIPVLWLAGNIAFGVRTAPSAIWLGTALGIGLLGWAVAHRVSRQHADSAQVLLNPEDSKNRLIRELFAAALVIAIAAVAGVTVSTATAERIDRHVLRDDVSPPLELAEFVSPLASYRLYELDLKDEVLFTVRGMPDQSRLRLAVMDTYDGNVFTVSQASSHYLRVGRQLPQQIEGEQASLTISTKAYEGPWLASTGAPTRIEFTSEDHQELAETLYHNRFADQTLATARLSDGSNYEMDTIVVPELTAVQRDEIRDAGAGSAPLAEVQRVPDIIVKKSTEWASDATSAYEQLDILAQKLRDEGFYSDGSDGKSRSGHTQERLTALLSKSQMIGDDEQYATAMALMANQLGIPARVVLGFYPEGDVGYPEEWQVTGTQAHVWVEANLADSGWVTFDPTPDRDKVPQSDSPKPKPKPKPQVDPPPDPPERVPDEPIVAEDEAARRDEDQQTTDWAGLFLAIGIGVGAIGLFSFPFVVILGLKRRRARLRQTRGTITDQLAGAWLEVVDKARDAGYQAATSLTRLETAAQLATKYPDVPLGEYVNGLDARVFGAVTVSADDSESAWTQSRELRSSMMTRLPWYRRLAAVFSLRSLRRARVSAPVKVSGKDSESLQSINVEVEDK